MLSFLKGSFFSKPAKPERYWMGAGADLEDRLLEAASRLEADGGMPGDSFEERIAASLDLLERLFDHGSTRDRGTFRHHVRRLLDFLGDVVLNEEQQDRLAKIVSREGRPHVRPLQRIGDPAGTGSGRFKI
jgi:hypothetical protein